MRVYLLHLGNQCLAASVCPAVCQPRSQRDGVQAFIKSHMSKYSSAQRDETRQIQGMGGSNTCVTYRPELRGKVDNAKQTDAHEQ